MKFKELLFWVTGSLVFGYFWIGPTIVAKIVSYVSPQVELRSNDYGPDVWHYVSPAGQDIEVRGEHKYPVHLNPDGSVEIESGGNKMMVIVHPLKKEKP